MSSFTVGPKEYKRLLEAVAFYEKLGYRYDEAPWAVSEQAMNITRPSQYRNLPTMSYRVNYHGYDQKKGYESDGVVLCPVASAEQSFLHDQLTNEYRIVGRYVTLTPCFRNEEIIDVLHRPYFMKVELINWTETSTEVGMYKMIHDAEAFFRKECKLKVDVIPNLDPDPISVTRGFDIVTRQGRVELGSYGIREHESVGRWVYGTGCAEPRLTRAMEIEESCAG